MRVLGGARRVVLERPDREATDAIVIGAGDLFQDRFDLGQGGILAAIADGVDGTVARRLGVAGAFGGELDSLSDIIAFGVAPAFLFSGVYGEVFAPTRLILVVIFVAAGAYRLARFHVLPSGPYFVGLPIPSAGILADLNVDGKQIKAFEGGSGLDKKDAEAYAEALKKQLEDAGAKVEIK